MADPGDFKDCQDGVDIDCFTVLPLATQTPEQDAAHTIDDMAEAEQDEPKGRNAKEAETSEETQPHWELRSPTSSARAPGHYYSHNGDGSRRYREFEGHDVSSSAAPESNTVWKKGCKNGKFWAALREQGLDDHIPQGRNAKEAAFLANPNGSPPDPVNTNTVAWAPPNQQQVPLQQPHQHPYQQYPMQQQPMHSQMFSHMQPHPMQQQLRPMMQMQQYPPPPHMQMQMPQLNFSPQQLTQIQQMQGNLPLPMPMQPTALMTQQYVSPLIPVATPPSMVNRPWGSMMQTVLPQHQSLWSQQYGPPMTGTQGNQKQVQAVTPRLIKFADGRRQEESPDDDDDDDMLDKEEKATRHHVHHVITISHCTEPAMEMGFATEILLPTWVVQTICNDLEKLALQSHTAQSVLARPGTCCKDHMQEQFSLRIDGTPLKNAIAFLLIQRTMYTIQDMFDAAVYDEFGIYTPWPVMLRQEDPDYQVPDLLDLVTGAWSDSASRELTKDQPFLNRVRYYLSQMDWSQDKGRAIKEEAVLTADITVPYDHVSLLHNNYPQPTARDFIQRVSNCHAFILVEQDQKVGEDVKLHVNTLTVADLEKCLKMIVREFGGAVTHEKSAARDSSLPTNPALATAKRLHERWFIEKYNLHFSNLTSIRAQAKAPETAEHFVARHPRTGRGPYSDHCPSWRRAGNHPTVGCPVTDKMTKCPRGTHFAGSEKLCAESHCLLGADCKSRRCPLLHPDQDAELQRFADEIAKQWTSQVTPLAPSAEAASSGDQKKRNEGANPIRDGTSSWTQSSS